MNSTTSDSPTLPSPSPSPSPSSSSSPLSSSSSPTSESERDPHQPSITPHHSPLHPLPLHNHSSFTPLSTLFTPSIPSTRSSRIERMSGAKRHSVIKECKSLKRHMRTVSQSGHYQQEGSKPLSIQQSSLSFAPNRPSLAYLSAPTSSSNIVDLTSTPSTPASPLPNLPSSSTSASSTTPTSPAADLELLASLATSPLALFRKISAFTPPSAAVTLARLQEQYQRKKTLVRESAALAIQCLWRGYRARKSIKTLVAQGAKCLSSFPSPIHELAKVDKVILSQAIETPLTPRERLRNIVMILVKQRESDSTKIMHSSLESWPLECLKKEEQLLKQLYDEELEYRRMFGQALSVRSPELLTQWLKQEEECKTVFKPIEKHLKLMNSIIQMQASMATNTYASTLDKADDGSKSSVQVSTAPLLPSVSTLNSFACLDQESKKNVTLKQRKRTLQSKLAEFTRSFQEHHGRAVCCANDLAPVKAEWAEYKALKTELQELIQHQQEPVHDTLMDSVLTQAVKLRMGVKDQEKSDLTNKSSATAVISSVPQGASQSSITGSRLMNGNAAIKVDGVMQSSALPGVPNARSVGGYFSNAFSTSNPFQTFAIPASSVPYNPQLMQQSQLFQKQMFQHHYQNQVIQQQQMYMQQMLKSSVAPGLLTSPLTQGTYVNPWAQMNLMVSSSAENMFFPQQTLTASMPLFPSTSAFTAIA